MSKSVPAVAAAIVPLLAVSQPITAQERPEPILESIREVFGQPGLTLGTLFQSVIDPGLDGEPASVQVAAARLLLSGELDDGFDYFLQTNFAASPSLLDARVGWSHGPSFKVSAGRFKAPFSRELLTFAGSIDFVNRSRVVDALAPNRQLGVQVGGTLQEHLSWSAGGFTGRSNATPNESLAGVVRVEGVGLDVGEGTLTVAGHAAVGRDGAVGVGAFGPGYQGDGVLLGIDGRFQSGALLLAGEVIRADWDPLGPASEVDADGLYLTAGWMVRPDHQGLLRWDRYRSPAGSDDDVLLVGYNTWPASASEIQVNWVVPLRDSAESYALLVNFQVGF